MATSCHLPCHPVCPSTLVQQSASQENRAWSCLSALAYVVSSALYSLKSNPYFLARNHFLHLLGSSLWLFQLPFIFTEPQKQNDRNVQNESSVSVSSLLGFCIYGCSISVFPISELVTFSTCIPLRCPALFIVALCHILTVLQDTWGERPHLSFFAYHICDTLHNVEYLSNNFGLIHLHFSRVWEWGFL